MNRFIKRLDVYDPAMCCSTGVCGPQVDPVLIRFSADVKWLEDQGVEVRRFNLSQNPAAFVENEMVRQALTEKGEAALPLLLVQDQVLASGEYPGRSALAEALELNGTTTSLFSPAVKELVAIGAAIAANCEPCLRYHVRAAKELGVTASDIASTIEIAAKVKDVPHQAILKLGARLTESCNEPAAESGPSAPAAMGAQKL
jgi:AhpD family alkylhydroperoxidase